MLNTPVSYYGNMAHLTLNSHHVYSWELFSYRFPRNVTCKLNMKMPLIDIIIYLASYILYSVEYWNCRFQIAEYKQSITVLCVGYFYMYNNCVVVFGVIV